MQALIFHEIGHIWHKTYGNLYPEARSEGEKSLAQLYQEGLAMVCEHILCQDDRYYHQNQNGWLDWCKENEAEIKREYLRRVDKNISTQDFFRGLVQLKNHSDVGYYLAASSSNICSGNIACRYKASMSISYIIILRSLRRSNKRTTSSKKAFT